MKASRMMGFVAVVTLAGMTWALGELVYTKYQLLQGDVIVAIPAAIAKTDVAPLPADLAVELPLLEESEEIVERPMFSPSRRPVEVAVLEETREPAPLPTLDVDLVGVVIWEAERFALVRSKLDSKVVKVSEGGDVGGWVAVGIGPERVLLRRGDLEQELRLKYKDRQ